MKYIYLLFSHLKGAERCVYISHQKNNILFSVEFVDRTFVSEVIFHPNCYFPSLLNHSKGNLQLVHFEIINNVYYL